MRGAGIKALGKRAWPARKSKRRGPSGRCANLVLLNILSFCTLCKGATGQMGQHSSLMCTFPPSFLPRYPSHAPSSSR